MSVEDIVEALTGERRDLPVFPGGGLAWAQAWEDEDGHWHMAAYIDPIVDDRSRAIAAHEIAHLLTLERLAEERMYGHPMIKLLDIGMQVPDIARDLASVLETAAIAGSMLASPKHELPADYLAENKAVYSYETDCAMAQVARWGQFQPVLDYTVAKLRRILREWRVVQELE